ncbi:hypothetical protein [Streptomyces sp. NPDC005009]
MTLRMLDRMSRIALQAVIDTNGDFLDRKRKNVARSAKKITPHLAVSLLPDGHLAIAGNTGDKKVTANDKQVVEAAGTHDQFFPGWVMPEWMKDHPEAEAAVERMAQAAGRRLGDGVLRGDMTEPAQGAGHDPDESASEWEADDWPTGEGRTATGPGQPGAFPGNRPCLGVS